MRPLTLAAVLACLAGCSGKAAGPTGGGGGSGGVGGQPPVEICDNGIDDDGNGDIDCADSACASSPHCPFCGDGLQQDPELCDGPDLGKDNCVSLQFNGGGQVACKPDCTYDTSGCKRHEDCQLAGDEDGNGLADCADPACARLDGCLALQVVNPPDSPHVDSAQTLQVRVLDGKGSGVAGRSVMLSGPAGSVVPTAPAMTDADGVARFDVLLGRAAGSQKFTATLAGVPELPLTLDVVDPPAGNVHTVVSASRQTGSDSSGPAIGAHLGRLVGMAVAEDKTLILAEGCRILSVSPSGVLSVLAGTGGCGTAEDGSLALSAPISVTDLALDAKNKRLIFVDPSVEAVRAIDLAAGTISTLAGGGTGGDGPATGAALQPNAVAVAPDGSLYISDVQTQAVRRVDQAGALSTLIRSNRLCPSDVNLVECLVAPCRPLVDAGGNAFVAGSLCGSTVNPDMPTGATPGLVRIARGTGPRGHAVPLLGNASGLEALGQLSTQVRIEGAPIAAFDPAGNLFAIAGHQLLRVDDRTWATQAVASWKDASFAGEDVSVDQAGFANPVALAAAPDGDLYIADGLDGSVRRVVAAGQTELVPLTVTINSGDQASADLAQKLHDPLSVTIKDGSKALSGRQVLFVPDDPGIAIYPGADTDAMGTASRVVRLGITPGAHTISASLPDLHGGVVPTAAVFHVTGTEPPVGNIITLLGGGSTNPHVFEPGEVLPATITPIEIRGFSVASDGTAFLSTGADGQLLALSTSGTLELLAGAPGGGSDADGPAIDVPIMTGDMAVTADVIYYDDQGGNARLRGIERSTGILRTYIKPWNGGHHLTLGLKDQLFDINAGIIGIDPVAGTTSMLVPTISDCTTDGIRSPQDIAGSSAGIAFQADACKDGFESTWLGWIADDATIHLLAQAYTQCLGMAPDGGLLYSSYYDGVLRRLDPVTGDSSPVAGGGTSTADDVPATQAALGQISAIGYSKGHLLLQTDPGIRVIW